MLRRLTSMTAGAVLGLAMTFASFASELFSAVTVLKTLDIREQIMVTAEGRTYRLSTELLPVFDKQQRSGQLKEGSLVRISGQYGRTRDGQREPVVSRIQALSQ